MALTSENLKEVYYQLAALVVDTDEAAWLFQQDLTAEREREVAQRNEIHQRETDARKRRMLISDFDRETKMLDKHMSEMIARMAPESEEPWRPESAVIGGEILFCEKRFDAAKHMMEQAVESEADEAAIEGMKARGSEAEAKFRQQLVQLKSLSWRGKEGSDTSSANSSQRSVVTEPEADKFKNKKIDYPRFSGDVRQYLSFKRDFDEIVKKTGRYTPQEISLILRNHCLQGQVKNDYQNLTDFKMIEDRLDEEYLDKERVVDMVTQQLTEARPIKWDDYNGFVDLVNMVEMGHLDLAAAGNSTTMSNPMTVRLIESKCPDWVIKALISAKETEPPDEG